MERKYRHEYKYRIDSMQAAVLESRVSMLLQADAHVNAGGVYQIKSLYFDDYNNSCLRENEDGVDIRSKFRIRYYNNDAGYIRLEKKSKQNGMTAKESCEISQEMCQELMRGRIPVITQDMPQILQSLLTEMQLRCLVPKVIVVYERVPYVYEPGNVRITFDRNLASSNEVERFFEKETVLRPVLPVGESLMEVKWDEIFAEHIKTQLGLDDLQWTSFSKYYLCRKYDCYGGVGV